MRYGPLGNYYCMHPKHKSIKDTPNYCKYVYPKCEDVNSNNDCKLFRESFLSKISRYIGFSRCES